MCAYAAGFFPGEPMRGAWQLIALSAASGLAGSTLIQIFGTKSRLNPLSYFPEVPNRSPALRNVGLVLDGPCRFALLAVALFLVLRLYRQSGFLGRFTALDWVALAGFGLYVVREATQVVAADRQGKQFSPRRSPQLSGRSAALGASGRSPSTFPLGPKDGRRLD